MAQLVEQRIRNAQVVSSSLTSSSKKSQEPCEGSWLFLLSKYILEFNNGVYSSKKTDGVLSLSTFLRPSSLLEHRIELVCHRLVCRFQSMEIAVCGVEL